MAAGPLTDDAGVPRTSRHGARDTRLPPDLDADVAPDSRFARLETRGRRSGLARFVSVGFVAEPDGSILVAAGGWDRDWARNLLADPAVVVTIGGQTWAGVADELDDRDPRRGRTVRELILRQGTPAEGLGSGPVFVIRPADGT